MFLTAAQTLAKLVKETDINKGSLYPKLAEIRDISLEIAIAVAEKTFELDLAQTKKPENLRKSISEYMFDPKY